MSDVALEFRIPPPAVAPFVTLFYRFRSTAARLDDLERAGHAQFRFRLSPGRADYVFADGTCREASPIHVVGPTSGVTRTRAEGPVHVFGMGLTPVGWAALLHRDASALANDCIEARAVCAADLDAMAAVLAAAATIEAMMASVGPLLAVLFAGDHRINRQFVATVDAWLAGSPSPAIDTLVVATRLSRRHVERRCNMLYGAPPKLLARKYRALRAATALAAGAADHDALIADGFYDQSHLIREVKHFTGVTPGRMHEPPGELTQLTIAHRRALAGRVHPIISDT